MSYHCTIHKSIECNGCMECKDQEELLTPEEIEEFEQFEQLLEEDDD